MQLFAYRETMRNAKPVLPPSPPPLVCPEADLAKIEAVIAQRKKRLKMPDWAAAIVTRIAEEVGCEPAEIAINKRRFKWLAPARAMAAYEIMAMKPEHPALSFQMLGRWFGGRHHTTIIYLVAKHAHDMGLPPLTTFSMPARRKSTSRWHAARKHASSSVVSERG